MRHQTQEYVAKFLESHEVTKVLEVGSLDVNGNVRGLFKNVDFTGTDMRDGVGVDMVVNGHDLHTKFAPEQFDLVLCFDTFEHDDAFWLTLDQMKRVLKPGGWIILGFPSNNCPEHDHPHDYWRFMPQSAQRMLQEYDNFQTDAQKDDPSHDDWDEIYCLAQKPL